MIRECIQEMKRFVLNPKERVGSVAKVKKALQPEGRSVEAEGLGFYREL